MPTYLPNRKFFFPASFLQCSFIQALEHEIPLLPTLCTELFDWFPRSGNNDGVVSLVFWSGFFPSSWFRTGHCKGVSKRGNEMDKWCRYLGVHSGRCSDFVYGFRTPCNVRCWFGLCGATSCIDLGSAWTRFWWIFKWTGIRRKGSIIYSRYI
jgi:hypothetical protein